MVVRFYGFMQREFKGIFLARYRMFRLLNPFLRFVAPLS